MQLIQFTHAGIRGKIEITKAQRLVKWAGYVYHFSTLKSGLRRTVLDAMAKNGCL